MTTTAEDSTHPAHISWRPLRGNTQLHFLQNANFLRVWKSIG